MVTAKTITSPAASWVPVGAAPFTVATVVTVCSAAGVGVSVNVQVTSGPELLPPAAAGNGRANVAPVPDATT